KWLPFYSMPYYSNRYLSNSVRGWLNQPTKYDADYEQGFAPSIRDTSWGDMDTATLIVANPDIPPAIWESTDQIREVCKANNCTLILVVSPLFHRKEACIPNYRESFDAFKFYAARHQLPFIDFGHDSIRFDKNMYADPAHLGKEGAKQFTRKFSAALMQYIRQ
ncbi:MAG TPA: hypothetical protein VK826_08240, partial [Bacteroidia bacterium]|nr:hypothetical protein [Bacteroidia bacterium]